ncbi:MAG TPA: 30S ribosomal protein S9 [Thermotogota bacterium]|jgi:small subunit ribosomal protein S9|nr:30S ribosomal protein S9 [Thermotogota bacterium]NLH18866.1 30S ribosomal protein S9 [Thermotogaceae bacterium]OQC29946.1 MAG: 30S ribosomal protein S9 [Thermotogota bacterium ADurb.Bin062]HNW46678.1 30S ribosomal protein S9 [Thermotogota bacterium]HNY81243.1 30S ribosomal protein S9 [Thermotogota bacterium]
MENPDYYGTGRRKTSVARVHLRPGTGKIKLNGKPLTALKDYLLRDSLVIEAMKPLTLTGLADRFDLVLKLSGGGLSGQAGALKMGIARALLEYNNDLRPTLKAAMLLQRDSRMVERKKYGLKKARRAPQYSKR